MRVSTMLWFSVCLISAALLYGVKYQVQEMDAEIYALNKQIAEEKSSIHILGAEWAYLTRPERLRVLSKRHLKLQSVDGEQMVKIASVPFSENASAQLAQAKNKRDITILAPASISHMKGSVQVAELP